MQKILVPVNGSATAMRALQDAIDTARSYRAATIVLVHVQPLLPRHVARFLSHEQMNDYRREQGLPVLRAAQERVEAAGIPVEAHLLRGCFVPAIVRFVSTHKIDEIVLGASPVDGLARWIRRPAAHRLIGATEVPVELVYSGHSDRVTRYGLPAGLGLGLTMVWLASE